MRFTQCLFRWREDTQRRKDGRAHLVNAGKYLTSLLVLLLSSIMEIRARSAVLANTTVDNRGLTVAWICALVVRTVYSYAWDLVKDWGLLQGAAVGWLRPRLLFPRRAYYTAMVLNLIGRTIWSLAISPHYCLLGCTLTFGIVEIIRRSIWIVFRVENEYLHAGGQRTDPRPLRSGKMDVDLSTV